MVARLIIFISFWIAFVGNLSAQKLSCGTKATAKDIEVMKSLRRKATASPSGRTLANSDPVNLAIKAHMVRKSDGTGGLTEPELNDVIENLNGHYAPLNITFFLLEINYIDNTTYFDFNDSQERDLTQIYNVETAINVYFFNSITLYEDNLVCGYAYFPETDIDHIMIDVACAAYNTLAHELGHYFSLPHTHGYSNSSLTDELVDGSNCLDAGDYICDTPADPNLYKADPNTGEAKVNAETCAYVGTETDANGDRFVPDTKNIMSYSVRSCRDRFSQEQEDQMVIAYQDYKTYLLTEDYIALFDADTKRICQGEKITFTNRSERASSYQWTFAGGMPASSTEKHPEVIYHHSGTFDVTLTITTPGGEKDTKSISEYIFVEEEVITDKTCESGSFEETTLKEQIINEDNDIAFSKTDIASTDGDHSVFVDFFSYASYPEEDYLIFAELDHAINRICHLTFDYAYAPFDDDYFDGLAVAYRTPCEEWQTVWEKHGQELQTTANVIQDEFVPLSNEWKSEEIILDIPKELGLLQFAFKAINGYGNNLYIDNYQIKDVPSKPIITHKDGKLAIENVEGYTVQWYNEGILVKNETQNTLTPSGRGSYTVEVSNDVCSTSSDPFVILSSSVINLSWKIYPNPAITQLRMSLPDHYLNQVKLLQIRDLSGRVILRANYKELLNITSLNSGMYLIELSGEGFTMTKRFLKE